MHIPVPAITMAEQLHKFLAPNPFYSRTQTVRSEWTGERGSYQTANTILTRVYCLIRLPNTHGAIFAKRGDGIVALFTAELYHLSSSGLCQC